jgi:hypothetical protein
VKFLRQFAVVVMVIAIVVLIGMAWSRLAPSLPGEGPAGHAFVVRGQVVKGLPPGVRLPRGATPPPAGVRRIGGTPRLLLGDLLKPVNLVVLRNNAFLEAAVIAAVVIVDASYRRLRRARRARTSQSP